MIESELPFYALNDFEMKELLTYDVLPFECYADNFLNYYEHDGIINCHMNPDLTFDPQFASKITSNYYSVTDFNQKMKSSHEGGINSLFLNARSIPRNFDEILLEFDISENNLDFLCVAETWLTKNTESLYSIERYNSFYNSRETRGGGTAVFVRNRYNASKIVNLCFTTAALESTFVYISDGSLSLVIGCFYGPPSAGIREFMLKIEDVLSYIRDNYRCKIVVHGDFNIDARHTAPHEGFYSFCFTYRQYIYK